MNRILPLLSVAITALFIISCSKEVSVDTTHASPAGASGNFRAKIDGKEWVADKVTEAVRLQGIISIAGISVDKKTVAITLLDSGVHTYTLSSTTINVAAYIDSSVADPTSLTTNAGINPGDAGGTLTITKIDESKKTISGTFQFTVFHPDNNQKKTFTEGVFADIPYSTDPIPGTGTGNGKDTFAVKVDGVLWKPGFALAANAGVQFTITGMEGTDKWLSLFFPGAITPGTYPIGDLFTPYSGSYNGLESTTGSLQILEYNTSARRIRGTFNFHAEDALGGNATELTEGYFSLSYY